MRLKKRLFVLSLSLGAAPLIAAACNSAQYTDFEGPTPPSGKPLVTKPSPTPQMVSSTVNLNGETNKQVKTLADGDEVQATNLLDEEQKAVLKRFQKYAGYAATITNAQSRVFQYLEFLSDYLSVTEDLETYFLDVNTFMEFWNFVANLQSKLNNVAILTKDQYQYYGLDSFVTEETKLNKALKAITGLEEFDSPETSLFVVDSEKLASTKAKVEALKKEAEALQNPSDDVKLLRKLADDEEKTLETNEAFTDKSIFIINLIDLAHQYNQVKEQAAFETQYSGLDDTQRGVIVSLKYYLELTKNDKDGNKKVASLKNLITTVINKDSDRSTQNYSLEQENKDMKAVTDFYTFVNSESSSVNVNTTAQYNATKLGSFTEKWNSYKDALKKVYDLVFDYNINILSTSYENKKTMSDLIPVVTKDIEKYKKYRFNDLFINLGMKNLANQKHQLDVYYDQLTTLTSTTSEAGLYQLLSSTSDSEYYGQDDGLQKTIAFLIISNLKRFDDLYTTFSSTVMKLDSLNGLAEKLLPFVSDHNGETNAAKLSEEFGKNFTVAPFDQTKLTKDLSDIKTLYAKSEELYNQLKAADSLEKLTAFETSFNDATNGFDATKKAYDEALKDLQDSQQNARKQVVINNKNTFEQQSEEFLDLEAENSGISDPKVVKAQKATNVLRYVLKALYDNKDINTDDDSNRKAQETLARAYVNVVGPALSTELQPKDKLGYDLLITLKTDIDRIWFYSETLRVRWTQAYTAYQNALKAYKDSVAANSQN
ncbi:hypothetical protein NPA08_01990 [Mycoplasmopsis citelli]|uniref:hypothetical protein n=1 Tax=Mycoplasmopsis citelli TaxID=171281 RepID=UPI002113E94D|nr:hypothetical protein [Mycoplasmopsis citelli]UUD36582.1 hypothetical protein NPA08_01990 [Mycoplasmopsis citelli]